jgi:hypothetical protein
VYSDTADDVDVLTPILLAKLGNFAAYN